MALSEIRAAFRCDGCGKPFSIQIDPAGTCPDGWSMFDAAEDAVRGSIQYQGPNNPNGTGGASSVQDEKHLCGPCTKVADESTPEE